MIVYLVFKDMEQVGVCYMIEYEGIPREPTFVNDKGDSLKSGMYELYQMDSWLIVVNETIQQWSDI